MTRAQAMVDDGKRVSNESTDVRSGATTGRPGLDVSVSVRQLASESDGAMVRVRVNGASGRFRVYVYADGELVEAWIPAAASNECMCRTLVSGRHAVTARAIDALGRWGGASVLYGPTDTLHAGPRSAPTSRDRGPGCTVATLDPG